MKTIVTNFVILFFVSAIYAQTTVTTFTDGTPDDAIAIDGNGNLYASNFQGDTVFKFDEYGNATPFITGLNTPNGLAFDSNDNLFVCDFAANNFLKYDSSGNQISSTTIPGGISGLIKAFDNDDMIYTRYSGNSINRITPAGVITEVSSAPELNGPVGLAYDEFGILYVGNFNNREIYRVESTGDLTYIAQLPGSGSSHLGFITFAQGKLFGTVLGTHKIYSVDVASVDSFNLFAGSVMGAMDGDISVATFNRPNGILANATGDVLYVTDYGSKNFRIISDVVLAVEDVKLIDNRLMVFPNPAQDRITIEGTLSEANPYSILVFDVLGRVLFRKQYSTRSTSISENIDSSSWQLGVYFVQLSSGNSSTTKQIVK